MPPRAALVYLGAAVRRDIFVTDMLFYTARGFVKEPENLPRYYDLVAPRATARELDYSVSDVVDMFRGEGKLIYGII